MDKTNTLLDTLSPQLQALVASFSLQTNVSRPATSSIANATIPSNKKDVETISTLKLNPSDVFVVSHPQSPGAVVKQEFLGRQNALAVQKALEEVEQTQVFHMAKVGTKENLRNDETVRGDRILWIQPLSNLESSLSPDNISTNPAIQYLLKQVEAAVYAIKKMSPEMRLHNVVSIQFAIFPGTGSRFVKHFDTSMNVENNEYSVKSKNGLVRLLTCIYYLNDQWKPEHGGHLRVHVKESAFLPAYQWDIAPQLDTLLVFRSLDVEHEVLPTYHERKALTIWYYGKPPPRVVPCHVQSVRSEEPPSLRLLCLTTDNRLEHAKHASIFVAIPSYRDSECRHTVDHLLAQATYADRVYIGLCLQTDCDDDTQLYLVKRYSQSKIRVCWMDYREAAGPCVARAQAQKLWQGEEFYLQIDSHMRFRPGWDCFLINELRKCDVAKPILTTYPLGYTLSNEISTDYRPTLLCASSFDELGMLRQSGRILTKALARPLPSLLWAAGFAFSSSRVITEVPYDEALRFLFFGEESLMAARLWTSGWDFFTPSETVIYHLWTRSYRPVYNELETEEMKRCRHASVQYAKQLLRINEMSDDKKYEGKYALGLERSFDRYQKHIGVDFATGHIEWWAQWGNIDPIRFDLTTTTTNSC